MEVILLEKIKNLGAIGKKAKVKPGYARNYLFPKSKAIPATKENLDFFESQRLELEKKAATALKEAEQRCAQLEALTVQLIQRASDEGKLFGSIGVKYLVDEITKLGVPVTKSEINLPTGPLRHIGDYEIKIQVHTDLTATVKVQVIPEK